MTTATQSQPIDVTDSFKNPGTLGRASLRFFREKALGSRGGRYVIQIIIGGEENRNRFFATIDEARDGWRLALAQLRSVGYTDRVGRKAYTQPY